MVRGAFVSRQTAEKTTFLSIIQRYIKDITPTHRGRDSEAIRLTAMSRHPICLKMMSDLTPGDFAAYRDDRLKSVAAATVQRELGLFQSVIEQGNREWGFNLSVNPVCQIRKPATDNARERRLDPLEERYIIDSTDACLAPWLRPVTEFAIETAMRQGEIISLTWDNIDLDKRSAYLDMTKNGDSRTVPLSSRAIVILKSLLKSDADDRVFRITASGIKQSWARTVKRARNQYEADCAASSIRPKKGFLVDLHFHDLRHEATSRLAMRVPNVLMLAAITGHKDLKMLKRYYHPRIEDLAEMIG